METKEFLKQYNLKATPARVKLYEYLSHKGHITSEEVFAWAKKSYKDYNRATIYNTLNSFEKVGLIKKLKLPNSNEFVYDTNTYEHFHYINSQTGEIKDLSPKQVKLSLPEKLQIQEIFIIGKGEKHG